MFCVFMHQQSMEIALVVEVLSRQDVLAKKAVLVVMCWLQKKANHQQVSCFFVTP